MNSAGAFDNGNREPKLLFGEYGIARMVVEPFDTRLNLFWERVEAGCSRYSN